MLSIPITNYNRYVYLAPQNGLGGTAALCQNIVLNKKQNFYLYTELGYLTNAYLLSTVPGLFLQYNGAVTTNDKIYQRVNYGYLSVSIQKVLFHFGKKVGVFAGIGAQASCCYSTVQTIEEFDYHNGQAIGTRSTTSYSISNDARWAAAGIARLGLMTNVTKHLALNIAPVFNFGLNPKYVFAGNTTGFHSLGLNLQIMYCF